MCGICGIVNYQNREIPSSNLAEKMLGSLAHRGPDSSGYYRDRNALLGHTRLAVIDLKTGAQPLSNEDESLWIVYNGEIYNYLELRDELIVKGHIFKTESDTEIIIHAWEEWREDCFRRFNGQWALAIWDAKRKELILSRDRFGIRPLFYTFSNKNFLFGSEIKVLFCDESVERVFDPSGFSEIFTFWSTIAPVTAYKNIKEVPAGSFSIVKNGKIHTKAYWALSFSSGINKSLEEYSVKLKELLINSTRLRFSRSDVPVGAYLSGGLDSSITASIISRYTNTHLHTYSLRFHDTEFDEGNYQQEIAKLLGTEHQSIMVSHRDVGEIFPEVIRLVERPILRTAPAPLFLLSRLVRDSGYKVVVTGEGADEVLGGYDIFREAMVRRFIASHPESEEIDGYLDQLYPWMDRAPGNVPAFAKVFFSKNLDLDDPFFSHRPRWNSTSSIMEMFASDFKEQVFKHNAEVRLKMQISGSFMDLHPLCRDQWLEYMTLLTGYILSAQGDRMMMGNSVEGRFPFLDHRLVEYANSLPADIKLHNLNEKYILKKAFMDMIPERILKRPKQPYLSPGGQSFFFSNKKLDWLEEVTSESMIRKAGVFKPGVVRLLMNKCYNKSNLKMSNVDNMRIVGILSTMLCYKYFIQRSVFLSRDRGKAHLIIDRV